MGFDLTRVDIENLIEYIKQVEEKKIKCEAMMSISLLFGNKFNKWKVT